MGLSASQARLLALTSRQHDLEYKAQNLEAQKLQMSNESDKVYEEYEDALNATKVQIKTVGTDGTATYVDADFTSVGSKYSFKVFRTSTGAWEDCADFNAIKALSDYSSISNNNSTLTNMVSSGFLVFVSKTNKDDSGNFLESNIATDTNFQEVSDETMLKKAEAKYEASMAKINQKDKKFDTDLASLDTERSAIKTEQETLKTVAKDNVDRTFKLFS